MDDKIDLSEAEILAANAAGDARCIDLISELESEDEDPGAVAYSIWVGLTHYLASYGWTAQDLASDAAIHASIENSDHNTVGWA